MIVFAVLIVVGVGGGLSILCYCHISHGGKRPAPIVVMPPPATVVVQAPQEPLYVQQQATPVVAQHAQQSTLEAMSVKELRERAAEVRVGSVSAFSAPSEYMCTANDEITRSWESTKSKSKMRATPITHSSS
jgi:hypothetical protein